MDEKNIVNNISKFDHNTPDIESTYLNAATQLDGAKLELETIYGTEDELRKLVAVNNATQAWVKYHEREANVLRRIIRAVDVRIRAFKAVEKSRKGIDTMTDEFDPDIRIEVYGSDNTYFGE